MYQLIFERRFVMGHRLRPESSPKCAIPHGHNEYVKVALEAKDPKTLDGQDNLITPFEQAKQTWHAFIDEHLDHALQLAHTDPLIAYFTKHEKYLLPRILVTHGDPSTEMLCACLMNKLQTFLDHENSPLNCSKITLQETPTNTVCLTGHHAYQKYLPPAFPASPHPPWWQRPDFSINDFLL